MFVNVLILTIVATAVITASCTAYYFNNGFKPTDKFRINEKRIGNLTFYRCEVYRKIFGWTPFYASRSNGQISVNESWTDVKSYCQRDIDTYKQLKPIK